ncbi:hypothetical protein C8J56DRAFT_1101294 [Mycena floridula]|nr:hypothetical protein C8J56DRAFT_1101294 [Mycena floridula]
MTVVALTSRTSPKNPSSSAPLSSPSAFSLASRGRRMCQRRAVDIQRLGLLEHWIHAVLVKSSLSYVGDSPTSCHIEQLGRGGFPRRPSASSWGNAGVGRVGPRRSGSQDVFLGITEIFGFLISVAGILNVNVTSPVMHIFSRMGQTIRCNWPIPTFRAACPTPATNDSSFHGWSIGLVYYSTLVIDLQANVDNEFTPAYATYENGVPMRMALFNYMDHPTGTSTVSLDDFGGWGEI